MLLYLVDFLSNLIFVTMLELAIKRIETELFDTVKNYIFVVITTKISQNLRKYLICNSKALEEIKQTHYFV